ncbi:MULTISPECIES: efflux RND transporter permease subunit [unclassified Synechococcus]|uniref:efflux RND transporter permease subunit n=1 Tax=unclassified Synechococcus TaxID=2626047 RepID=UPI000B9841D0|nr:MULTISPECIES: efflux RND transporter permease subunit [unclassified Synechococcus]MCP9829055.1 efflux RND transporter permease subunit [Synechococcus sp. L2F]MCP9846722.1 efflux RND transporter permease subunit [Synechococcus sp. Lug-A]
MSLSDTFIRRPVLSTVCSVLILLAGVIALPLLPIENLPDIAPPTIQVNANLPGADALTVESAVTGPLEEQINGAPGMDYITSTSTGEGSSQINVYFKPGTNADIDQVNVLNRVQTATPQLPPQVNAQGVTVQQTSGSYLLVYNLTSTAGQFDGTFLNGLLQLNLVYPLTRADGVGQVNIFGASDPAFRLWVDPLRLARFNLSITDVVNALKSQNVVVIAGSVGGPPSLPTNRSTFPILVNGNLETVGDFEKLILSKGPDGGLIRLGDVGRAEYAFQNFNQAAINAISGYPSVGFGVIQLPGSNAITTADAVDEVLTQFRNSLPPGVVLEKVFDQTDFINASIEGALDALRDAVVLVLLIIFLFLQDWKATAVPALALPIALLGAMVFVKAFGFSINELTLLGIILATGLVVDDAIVVVEAVSARIEAGDPPFVAASNAMKELTGAILATALVLLAVFVPVAFFPGATGVIYRQFALTIVFSIIVSTFNAITGKPLQSALLLGGGKTEPRGWRWTAIGGAFGALYGTLAGGWLLAVVLGLVGAVVGTFLMPIFTAFNKVFDQVARGYAALLQQVIRLRRLVLAALLGGVLLTGAAFVLIPTGFVPTEDQGYGLGIIQLPAQSSIEATMAVADEARRIIAKEPDVVSGELVGGAGFNGGSLNQGIFFFGFKPIEERTSPEQSANAIIGRMNQAFAKIPGAIVLAQAPAAVPGFGAQGGLSFQFNDLSNGGYSPTELAGLAKQLIAKARGTGTFGNLYTQFVSDAPVWRLDVDRDRMASLDIDFSAAMEALGTLTGGSFVNQTYEQQQYRQVYVQADASHRTMIQDLNNLYVSNRSGGLVPLSNVVKARLDSAPPIISHFDLYRTVLIQGVEAAGKSSGQAIDTIAAVFRRLNFANIGSAWSALTRSEVQAGALAILVFALGIVVVYLVLSAQYGSYIDPLIILMTVPLAMLGALMFLVLRGQVNNVYAQVGLVTLIGLAAKNGILIVDLANQRMEQGMSSAEAAMAAACSRLRPILMTAMAALAGFFPLLVASGAGALSQQSLGAVIFGGLLVATVLSLFVVPSFYVLMKQLEASWFPASQATEPVLPSGPAA